MARKKERLEIEIARRRVPLTKILHGREFSDVIAELKKFRTQFAEQEILYKAKVYFSFSYGEAMVFVRRPETDNEYAKRQEEERLLEEAKAERKRIRELKAQQKAEANRIKEEAEAQKRRLEEIEMVKRAARKLGLSAEDLVDM